ncbi:MAG: CocE/NonD family hydrolase [Litorilinea sp.]
MSHTVTTNQHEELYQVRVQRHVRIPMSDGIELDAHLYMPDAEGEFPAVFDYYPYRKDDLSAGNMRLQYYLAQRGHVGVRIDVRGTGSSGGIASDEYSRQEQLDAVEAIAWMAEQPWCNGNVGMFGTSYGGFNSVQVAMHRPPALKAICPMYFTDNRYTDDCHYKGGGLQMLYDVATYGLGMVVQNAMPPAPAATGDRWAEIWEEHLEADPWLLTWVSNHVYNDYWRQGSLCEDYSSIEAAVFIIGGWRDGYTNCNLRTFENINSPKKALIGPWLHVAPDNGQPGPHVDHLHEMVRFYDYWLKGIDNGVMDEPPITVYVQKYDPPTAERAHTSGFWRHESNWPLERSTPTPYYLQHDRTLNTTAPTATAATDYTYNPTVGTTFGMFSAGSPLVTPVDQRLEEAYSYSWATAPLSEPVEILGHPTLRLNVAVDTDIATVSVRLIDVGPDGGMALVCKGVLNLTHRESHTDPTPLEPGKQYAVEIELDSTSWLFEPGHRIQVSLAAADFPNIWPSPKLHTGKIYTGGENATSMVLPVLSAQEPALPTPKLNPPLPYTPHVSGLSEPQIFSTTHDHVAKTTSVRVGTSGRTRVNEHVTFNRSSDATATVWEDDPAHATIHGLSQTQLEWPGRTIDTVARAQIESNAETLNVTIQLTITMDGQPYHQKRWVRSIPRHLL